LFETISVCLLQAAYNRFGRGVACLVITWH